MAEIRNVGFIGFGAMAQRMAVHLRDKQGYAIKAFAQTQRDGERMGTPMVASLKDAVADADVVLISLTADEAIEATMYGMSGALANMRSGTLLINTTSNSPEASLRLYEAAKAVGVQCVDAPVSGSTPEAEAAQLVVICGGDDAAVARAMPVLKTISKAVHHVGGPAAGSKIKLAINGVMVTGMAAIVEAVNYCTEAGLDRDVVFDVFGGLAVVSPHHIRKLGTIRAGDFSPKFPAKLASKDMRLLLDQLNRMGVPAATLAAAAQMLALTAKQRPEDDYSALGATFEQLK